MSRQEGKVKRGAVRYLALLVTTRRVIVLKIGASGIAGAFGKLRAAAV